MSSSAELARTGIWAVAKVRQETRVDIQALRGFAVLLVVLYHSKLVPQLGAGYLGVDIFFVVSGYLITGLIRRGLENGSFSFTSFYIRRAKRLLPAAYVVLLLTALLSFVVLTPKDARDFSAQLVGAVTFTSNVVLWMQTGYFAGPAATKPLLHMWSLSIEEQYYLFLPMVMVLVPAKSWGRTIGVAFAASLCLCLVLVASKPGATFFLLPTRAWELLLGSLGALGIGGTRLNDMARRLTWPAALVIFTLPFLPTGFPHPGIDALTVCFATLMLLLGQHEALNENVVSKGLARIGDMSYSAYLVHWPMGALASSVWLTEVPQWVRLALLGATFLFGWLLYRYVENPGRRAPPTRRNLFFLAAGTVGILLTALIVFLLSVGSEAEEAGGGNLGLSVLCEYGETFSNKAQCRNAGAPRVMVWGDSQAMHLVDALATVPGGLVQATKTTCGPLLGTSAYRTTDQYNRSWAEGCISFNDSVLSYLKTANSVEVVVLSSLFSQYLAGDALVRDGRGYTDTTGDADRAFQALKATVEAVHGLGKRAILVAPPPSGNFDIGRCLDARRLRKLRLGSDAPLCEIVDEKYRQNSSALLSLINRIERERVVPVVRLDQILCKNGKCAVQIDDVPLYVDHVHLSHAGSRALGVRVDLPDRIGTEAR